LLQTAGSVLLSSLQEQYMAGYKERVVWVVCNQYVHMQFCAGGKWDALHLPSLPHYGINLKWWNKGRTLQQVYH